MIWITSLLSFSSLATLANVIFANNKVIAEAIISRFPINFFGVNAPFQPNAPLQPNGNYLKWVSLLSRVAIALFEFFARFFQLPGVRGVVGVIGSVYAVRFLNGILQNVASIINFFRSNPIFVGIICCGSFIIYANTYKIYFVFNFLRFSIQIGKRFYYVGVVTISVITLVIIIILIIQTIRYVQVLKYEQQLKFEKDKIRDIILKEEMEKKTKRNIKSLPAPNE